MAAEIDVSGKTVSATFWASMRPRRMAAEIYSDRDHP